MIQPFISGAMTMGYCVAALFFLRFWSNTKDRLFLFFSLSFFILALQRGTLGLAGDGFEDRIWLYILRLAAFVLILVAIIDKNRSHRVEN